MNKTKKIIEIAQRVFAPPAPTLPPPPQDVIDAAEAAWLFPIRPDRTATGRTALATNYQDTMWDTGIDGEEGYLIAVSITDPGATPFTEIFLVYHDMRYIADWFTDITLDAPGWLPIPPHQPATYGKIPVTTTAQAIYDRSQKDVQEIRRQV